MKRGHRTLLRLVVPLLALVMLIVLAMSYWVFLYPHMGKKINESWETSNGTFRIRVTSYAEEGGGFVGGAYYVHESAPVGTEHWKKVITVRHDDPDPIRRQNVRFVGRDVGYFFLGYDYAVSTDEGLTWSLWNATKNMPDWQQHRAWITYVEVEPNGNGTMILETIGNPNGQLRLSTQDYGRSWHEK